MATAKITRSSVEITLVLSEDEAVAVRAVLGRNNSSFGPRTVDVYHALDALELRPTTG